jgi:hypothetical protein
MRVVIVIVLAALSYSANGQNWNEWFRQKKTQRKYLLEQIAALKVYLDYTKKGYDIASKGLGTIRDIKSANLHMHTNYFESLSQVNPTVRNYVKVAGIISYQIKIMKQARKAIAGIKEAATFSPDEIDYCGKVFDKLLTETIENLDQLNVLVTSGKLEMKDDERLKRIDALYSGMQEMYGFCCAFSEEIALLSVQRLREKHDVQLSKTLNDLQ